MSDSILSNLAGVNPLLSNMIVGVGSGQNMIAEQVLPVITVDAETVTYRKGDNAALVAEGVTNTLRGVGVLPRSVDVSFSTGSVTLNEYMLEANLDYRETQAANAAPDGGVNLKMSKLAVVKAKVQLDKEQIVADLFGTSGNFATTSAAVNFGSTGIRATVLAAREIIRKGCGYDPNTIVLGKTTERILLGNADVQDMIKYSAGGVTYTELLARFFGVENVVIGSAVKQTAAAAGAAGTGSYVWTDDIAALVYVNRSAATPFNPSFSYLFQMPETVFEWNNNPLITHMAYGQRFAAPSMFTAAGYLWTNTDQA